MLYKKGKDMFIGGMKQKVGIKCPQFRLCPILINFAQFLQKNLSGSVKVRKYTIII